MKEISEEMISVNVGSSLTIRFHPCHLITFKKMSQQESNVMHRCIGQSN